jgi:hypothetical protein
MDEDRRRHVEGDAVHGGPVEPGPPGEPGGSGQWRSASAGAVDALQRAVPFLERLARAARSLALLALAGGAVIWWAVFTHVEGEGRAVSLVLWALALLAPPAVLLAVRFALRLLIGLPDRLRQLPERARDHATELGRLAGEARRVRERGRIRTAVSLVRLWRQASASRDLLDVIGPAAFLFAPWTLVSGIVATLAAGVEVAAGVVVLLWLVLS